MKKVYGYLRVSTAKQGEGVSLIAQKEAITHYAAKYNLEIIRWFEELETAAKQGRPLFTAMMKLLQKKKADGVIIHKIDRGARNLKDWADLGNLIDQGLEIHFAHESLDLQARGGRLSADIQAVIAADYIRNLRQEAIKGLYGRLKQGIYPFQAPTGYLDAGKGKNKIIDPIQAPLVKQAFELYATEQYTLETLSVYMEKCGLKNMKHKRVNINSLSVILNNPFYMGIMRVKGMTFSGGHEPIISPALFNRVQSILRGNTNQKINKHRFVYRKMISCHLCGYSLIAETQKGHIYYRCHTKGCPTTGLRETTVNHFLKNAIITAQLYPEEAAILDILLTDTEQEWIAKQDDLLNSNKLQMAQIQQKLERLTDCYVEGGLDKETYEQRKMALLCDMKAKTESEKGILQDKERLVKRTRKILERAKSLIKSFESAIADEKRKLVQMVTSNLHVEGKKLMVTMRSPFYEFANRYDLTSGEPEQATSRINPAKFVYSGMETSQLVYPPLSKAQLKQLLGLILEQVAQLSDSYDELENDLL